MKPELEQHLHDISKEQLIQLLQQLAVNHPLLLTEIASMLESFSSDSNQPINAEEDWNFSGDEQHGVLRSFSQPVHLPPDNEAHRQRIAVYITRLSQEDISPDILLETLTELIDEAIIHIGHNDSHEALDLFALLFDERLLERNPTVTSVFDDMIDAAMYSLEALLSEASSNTLLDVDNAALSPLLTPAVRHHWLERLFALWLKRLDIHRVEEDLPEIILDVAWNEDMLLLRNLVQNELQKQPHNEHTNIVDFNRQYRTRALEKFLKELPRM